MVLLRMKEENCEMYVASHHGCSPSLHILTDIRRRKSPIPLCTFLHSGMGWTYSMEA